jgi:6-pyruvoyltetrahydropterin/6-carboxytetrahydropterin synthase
MKVTLHKNFEFAAAQALPCFPKGHKCGRLHGHTFHVKVSVSGPVDPQTGLFYDHAVISEKTKPLIEMLDHSYLNDIEGLSNPTIENVCAWFWQKLENQLPGLCEITVYETEHASCTYRGEA